MFSIIEEIFKVDVVTDFYTSFLIKTNHFLDPVSKLDFIYRLRCTSAAKSNPGADEKVLMSRDDIFARSSRVSSNIVSHE